MSPDRRRHRGAHPEDPKLFAPDQLPGLRAAVEELSWLLTRGYAVPSALKLVGDRHGLCERQRVAVGRAACPDASCARRAASRLALDSVRGRALAIDGFNLLITVEAALGGGILLLARDGCTRDLSSVHGSYRSVEETDRAITLVGDALAGAGPESVLWLLDRPVSNSGRLAARIREIAGEHGWPWEVEAVFNPDRDIVQRGRIVVSSDSAVIDGASQWVDLAGPVVETRVPAAWRIDLRLGDA